jgi:hypothetical protein
MIFQRAWEPATASTNQRTCAAPSIVPVSPRCHRSGSATTGVEHDHLEQWAVRDHAVHGSGGTGVYSIIAWRARADSTEAALGPLTSSSDLFGPPAVVGLVTVSLREGRSVPTPAPGRSGHRRSAHHG